MLILSFAWGCGEKKEPSKTQVVSKKISIGKGAPTSQQGAQSPAETSAAVPEASKTEELLAVSDASRVYDPKERVNPFIPLFRAKSADASQGEGADAAQAGKKRKRRIPQTPLEKIGLDQLKLVAIIRASSGNRALVEDNTGKGYIIKNGTYIGLNSGMVTRIGPDSLIIEEELENLKGELVLQNTEIKLQKPAGE